MDMEPLTETWLSAVGFRWHQLERQPNKQWLLWIGDCCGDSYDSLGVEVAKGAMDGKWFCWLRADYAGRYSRFLHVKHVSTRGEIIYLVQGLTGRDWNPENNLYGMMRTPKQAAAIREDMERLDRRMMFGNPAWRDIEKDSTRGGALPEHMEGFFKEGLEGSGLRK